MKKVIRTSILSILTLAVLMIFSAGLYAQEKTEVTIQVKKDGKVIQDTTYQFDDASEARNAIEMMEILSGDDEHMEHVTLDHTAALEAGDHTRAMVFISEDGKKTEIKELQGDSLVWVKEGDLPHAEGKKVIVMKSGSGETFDILVDEDTDGDKIVKKKVRVVVPDDEKGNWTVTEEGDEKIVDKEDNVFILRGDDGEDIEVIVIKKGEDADVDKEMDMDIEKNIEIKVKKKK
jgi:hypothetical protein